MCLRNVERLAQIGPIGNRALRIGGRTQIKRAQAFERRHVQRRQIGQKAGLFRCVQIKRCRACGHSGAGIDLIKRIGHSHQPIGFWRCQLRGQKQPLARAGQGQNICCAGQEIIGQGEAAAQPGLGGGAPFRRPADRRVTTIIGIGGAQGVQHKSGRCMLRLAQGQRDRWLGRFDCVQKRAQPRKRRGGQAIKRAVGWDRHECLQNRVKQADKIKRTGLSPRPGYSNQPLSD